MTPQMQTIVAFLLVYGVLVTMLLGIVVIHK